MGKTTDTIAIVTDQGVDSSVGDYARRLVLSLEGSPFRTEVVSLCCYESNHLPGATIETTRYARGSLDVLFSKVLNSRSLRRRWRRRARNAHFIGWDYSAASAFARCVLTIHELYFTVPRITQGARTLALELGYNLNMFQDLVYLKAADEIIVPSFCSQEQVRKWSGVRTSVIHHCIDSTRFFYRDKTKSRKALGLPINERLLLNVSSSGTNKNLKTLERLVRSLPQGYKMVKVGAPISAPNLIGISHVARDDYPLLFNACDLYVHTSTREGFGQPLVEALGSGLPVVAGRCSTSPEILADSGVWVSNPMREEEYIHRILESEDPSVHRDRIERTLSRASCFSLARFRDAHLEVYQRVFGSNG